MVLSHVEAALRQSTDVNAAADARRHCQRAFTLSQPSALADGTPFHSGQTILVEGSICWGGVMRSYSTARHVRFRYGGFLLVAALGTSCAHLDPPMRASAEQEGERQSESPTRETVVRSAGSSSEACTVDFDDRSALSQIFDQARYTFASPTGRSPSGELESCNPRVHTDCWTWRQRCTRADVNVESIDYSHFHLLVEGRTDCYEGLPDPDDGHGAGFGILVLGTCRPADWTRIPRIMAPHDQSRWVKIWVGNAETQRPTYFDMESIWVLPNNPIELWFRKRDGTWWFWPALEAGGVWNIGDWARDVSEVRIRGAESARSAYRIGAFAIQD